MKKQYKPIVLLLLLLLLSAGCGRLDNSLSSPTAVEGEATVAAQPQREPAVDFTVQNAAGEKVDLFDFVGQPLVVNLWASW